MKTVFLHRKLNLAFCAMLLLSGCSSKTGSAPVAAADGGKTDEKGDGKEKNVPAAMSKLSPKKPTDFVAECKSGQIMLSWKSAGLINGNTTGGGKLFYHIDKKLPSKDFSNITQLPADTMSYTDGEVEQQVVYTYRLRAINTVGASDPVEISAVCACNVIVGVEPENCPNN